MKKTRSVTSTAPTRVDLAGGTLDIWPLNLFFENPVTLNMAVTINVSARASLRSDGKVILVSEDQGKRVEFASMKEVNHKNQLPLLSRLAAHFVEAGGVEIVTRSEAPAGAGLAGSSALNIAVCGALSKLTGKKIAPLKLIDIAKDIEAALLHVPTGLQDYGAAVFGGVNAFGFPPGGMTREPVETGDELGKRLVLFYSGQSRNSGINNWEMFKRVIDRHAPTMTKFARISNCAQAAFGSLKRGDWDDFEKAVAGEWKARKALFPAISTKVIDASIQAGMKAGAKAARICGAGGGGCFFLLCDERKRAAVAKAVEARGPKLLPFGLSRAGLKVYNSAK